MNDTEVAWDDFMNDTLWITMNFSLSQTAYFLKWKLKFKTHSKRESSMFWTQFLSISRYLTLF